jgi:phenylalanyl-tRNA synthetase beta chain
MKISLNWLQQFLSLPEPPDQLAQILTDCGLEVESVERIDAVPGGLQGLVVGQVLTCERHPDADKLSLTTVDVGTDQPLPIVCGAPNVATGQKVIVALVGTELHPFNGEPFVIKKAKIRGAMSEGMICAEDEIGLGSNHAGILVLNTTLPNGTPAAKYFNVEPDYCFEIGLTPNRADAASHWGVARDLKAVLGRDLKLPGVEKFSVDNTVHPIFVDVRNPEACPRFCGVTLDGVKVGPSPEWLRKRLEAVGLRSINNIVDVTNYVCHELGQPLHAYDWSKLAGQKIVVQTLPAGTEFVTLDGVRRTLAAADLMICDAERPVGIAGVLGGLDSGVQDSTTRVFLEVAQFDAGTIRRTAMRHGLKTDASFRFERGTDPNAKLFVLKRAALLIQEVAGGKITSEIVDTHPQPFKYFQIELSYRNIDRLIGQKLDRQRIRDILTSLDIKTWNESAEGFTASVPPYRVDVLREADIIEEILRIYGLNNIALADHLRTDFLAHFPEPARDTERQQFKLSQLLAGAGYQEIFTNSLTKPGYAAQLGESVPGEAVEILNKLSEDLGVLRQSMLFSGLEALAHNINRRQRDLRFFEFGKTYHRLDGRYLERPHLALYLTGNAAGETWQQQTRPVAFHDLRGTVQRIFQKLNLTGYDVQDAAPGGAFAYGLTYLLNRQPVVTLGQVRPDLLKAADVRQPVFFADFDWEVLQKAYTGEITYREISRYPEVRRDLSLVLDRAVTFRQVEQVAHRSERNLLRNLNVFDVYEGEKVGAGKKSYSVSFILQDFNQTLTDQQIDRTMQRLMDAFRDQLGAVIRT